MLDFIHAFSYHQCYVSLADWCLLVIMGRISTVACLGECERPEWLALYHQTVGKVGRNSFATLPIHNLGARRGRPVNYIPPVFYPRKDPLPILQESGLPL